tara:strand:+ start:4377 stop:4889 length:513 start_codon:yes stop_codon:yes gene_type:complete
MHGGKKAVIFWGIAMTCFSLPFMFYHFQKQTPVLVKIDPYQSTFRNEIIIHISGALESPGVYKLKPGTKVHQLLNRLDLWPNADIQSLNLAKTLRDGQKIKIKVRQTNHRSINLNMASHSQLMELPGIGPTTASKILNYRDDKGVIKSVDELKSIIGASKVRKIKTKVNL